MAEATWARAEWTDACCGRLDMLLAFPANLSEVGRRLCTDDAPAEKVPVFMSFIERPTAWRMRCNSPSLDSTAVSTSCSASFPVGSARIVDPKRSADGSMFGPRRRSSACCAPHARYRRHASRCAAARSSQTRLPERWVCCRSRR